MKIHTVLVVSFVLALFPVFVLGQIGSHLEHPLFNPQGLTENAMVERQVEISKLAGVIESKNADPAELTSAILSLGRLRAVEQADVLIGKLSYTKPLLWRGGVPPLHDQYPAIKALFHIGAPALPAIAEAIAIRDPDAVFDRNAKHTIALILGSRDKANEYLQNRSQLYGKGKERLDTLRNSEKAAAVPDPVEAANQQDLSSHVPVSDTRAIKYFDEFLAACPKDEIRCVWFLNGSVRIGMVMQLNMSTSETTTIREVHNHATQSHKTRKLSYSQILTLKTLATELPDSASANPRVDLVYIAHSANDSVTINKYLRRELPREVQRIYDIGGGYIDTSHENKNEDK